MMSQRSAPLSEVLLMDKTDMEKQSNFLEAHRIDPLIPSLTERYFKAKIFPEKEHCVLVHSNRLCLISVASTHPILTEDVEVESVNFDTVGKVSRLHNKVSGKFKRGGQKLAVNSRLCIVKTTNGNEYVLFSCVSGTLIEVNERLVEHPNLLKEKPWSEGYIAIILPPFQPTEKRSFKDDL